MGASTLAPQIKSRVCNADAVSQKDGPRNKYKDIVLGGKIMGMIT